MDDIVADLHQYGPDGAETTTVLLKLRIGGDNSERSGGFVRMGQFHFGIAADA